MGGHYLLGLHKPEKWSKKQNKKKMINNKNLWQTQKSLILFLLLGLPTKLNIEDYVRKITLDNIFFYEKEKKNVFGGKVEIINWICKASFLRFCSAGRIVWDLLFYTYRLLGPPSWQGNVVTGRMHLSSSGYIIRNPIVASHLSHILQQFYHNKASILTLPLCQFCFSQLVQNLIWGNFY